MMGTLSEEPDWLEKSPGSSENTYVLGHLISAQLKHHLETHITCSPVYKNEVASRDLVETFFGLGARENWQDTVLRATGKPLCAGHFVGAIS